jgi:membrane protease YdiL (CAAX protease family)
MSPLSSRPFLAKRSTISELAIVFALSLGASAVYSVVSLIAKLTSEAGLAGSTAALNNSLADRVWLDLTYQLLGIGFGLAPVALALYLIWQTDGRPLQAIGLVVTNPFSELAKGLLLAASIGIPGLGLYLVARALGLSAQVTPANLGDYWWAVPVLLLAAIKASLVEEVIVVGYLFNRLTKIGFSTKAEILISALVRGSYHLYQGFGGFIGNFIMGLAFGWVYRRFGRLTPLVVAHFFLDAASFVGYALLSDIIRLP